MFLMMETWLTLMENISGQLKMKMKMENNLSLREFFILSGKDKKIIVGSMFGINFSNKYFLVIISNRKVK